MFQGALAGQFSGRQMVSGIGRHIELGGNAISIPGPREKLAAHQLDGTAADHGEAGRFLRGWPLARA
jgi:hypothetical protein